MSALTRLNSDIHAPPPWHSDKRLDVRFRFEEIREGSDEHALGEQSRSNRQLGEVLVDLGVLDPADLKAVLALQESLSRQNEALRLAAGIRLRLGEMLLRAERITHAQLDAALAEQARTGEALGHILIRHGWIEPGELHAVLEFQRRQAGEAPTCGQLKLGELLVATGQITREQLEQGLSRQRQSGKKLGEDLVDCGLLKPHQLARALQLQQRLVTAALIAVLSLGSLSAPNEAAAAEPATSTLTVTATVLKYASLRVAAQPATVTITEADVARGYVDVPTPSRVEIKGNSPSGYVLVFESQSDFVRQTQVRGLGSEILLGATGGVIAQPGSGSGLGKSTIEIGFRFLLAQEARPGVYAWPMQVSVMPL